MSPSDPVLGRFVFDTMRGRSRVRGHSPRRLLQYKQPRGRHFQSWHFTRTLTRTRIHTHTFTGAYSLFDAHYCNSRLGL